LPLAGGPGLSEAEPIPAVDRVILLALMLVLGGWIAWATRHRS